MAITENELKAQLAQGVLKPVYVFHGEEPIPRLGQRGSSVVTPASVELTRVDEVVNG